MILSINVLILYFLYFRFYSCWFCFMFANCDTTCNQWDIIQIIMRSYFYLGRLPLPYNILCELLKIIKRKWHYWATIDYHWTFNLRRKLKKLFLDKYLTFFPHLDKNVSCILILFVKWIPNKGSLRKKRDQGVIINKNFEQKN